MSFLNELKKQKNKLKETETIVTKVDGQRFVENKDSIIKTLQSCYGFVVDTKPDNIPVLVSDYLYIGSQDCAANNVIQSYNIKHVLSLGIYLEVSVNHKFVQCLDLPESDIKSILSESLPFLKDAVSLRENILVHCNAGVSRTSMLAIAYLMQYEEMQFEDAYTLVKSKRPAIQPNDGFRKQLKCMTPGKLLQANLPN